MGIWAIGMALAVGCSRPRDTALAPQIPADKNGSQLTWGSAMQVPDTPVMRVDLIESRSGISSGYGALRNILFLDPAEEAGRWLLPDYRHVFESLEELRAIPEEGGASRPLGMVAVVKKVGQESGEATGKLIIFDPVGKSLKPLAEGVHQVNVASVAPSGEVVILYERSRQFVIAVVDATTFEISRKQVFDIPPLK